MTITAGIDQAIAGIARLQHGLVTTGQLLDLGLSSSAIYKRAARGLLHRIYRGVWSVGHDALSREARWCAAVLAAGPDAALSHVAAAAHWNIWRRSVPGIDVVTPHERRDIPGVSLHRSRRLARRDTTCRFRIRITTVARTILDLGDVLTPWQLANVIHEAEFRNRFDRRQLERLLARYRGRHAVTIVRRSLEIHDGGSAGTFSDLEDEFLARAHARGLRPLVNVRIAVEEGELRPDFHWPELRLVVEVDGSGHARKRSREEDRGRDARCRAAGWTVLRCVPSQFDRVLDAVASRSREVV